MDEQQLKRNQIRDARPAWTITDRELAAAIASLNDVLSEVVAGLAAGEQVTKGYAHQVVLVLSQSTRTLGVNPSLTPDAIADWEGET